MELKIGDRVHSMRCPEPQWADVWLNVKGIVTDMFTFPNGSRSYEVKANDGLTYIATESYWVKEEQK